MTKLKSKKMTKSTFAIIIMAIAMVAMLAFGGTYAYFTATADQAAGDTVHTALIALQDNATVTLASDQKANLLPGETVSLSATISNLSTRESYVFVKFAVDADGDATLDFTKDANLAGTDGTKWTKITESGAVNVYYMIVAAKTDVELSATATFTATATSNNGAEVTTQLMNQDITVTARFASVQVGGDVANAPAAYALIADSLTIS